MPTGDDRNNWRTYNDLATSLCADAKIEIKFGDLWKGAGRIAHKTARISAMILHFPVLLLRQSSLVNKVEYIRTGGSMC